MQGGATLRQWQLQPGCWDLMSYQSIPRTPRGRLRIPSQHSVLVKVVVVTLSPITKSAGLYGSATAHTTPTRTIAVPDCTTANGLQLLHEREVYHVSGRPYASFIS
jgi:hypothetical protein